MSKSRRRWVRNAHTPIVHSSGRYYDPSVKIIVFPAGKPNESVSFELDWWQVKDLRHQLAGLAKMHAARLRESADLIAQQGGSNE